MYHPSICLGGFAQTEKLRIIGVMGKIRTGHLLDASQKHYSLSQLANYSAAWNSLVVSVAGDTA
jgi:hypothetical protein